MSAGLVKEAEPVRGAAQGVVRVSFPVVVFLPLGGSQGSMVCGDAVRPMHAPVEVFLQQGRKLPGVGVATGSASEPYDGEQYRGAYSFIAFK